jgi:hypothetical protein
MVVPLAQENDEICTGRVILQPISLKPDRLLVAANRRFWLQVECPKSRWQSFYLQSRERIGGLQGFR